MGLAIGDAIPLFSLRDHSGGIFHIQDVLGAKPLVLFFYPGDYTPGCTAEVCAFRDQYQRIRAMGADVIGISGDPVSRHNSFASRYRLPYVLLADVGNQVKKLFRVQNRFFNLLPGRETYIVDRQGKVLSVCSSMHPAEHIRAAMQALGKLQGL